MTRRRAFLLLLGALVVVYVVGGVVGVGVTRARLLGDIDDRLRVSVKSLDALTTELPLDLEDFAATREGDRVALLVSPDGIVLFERMPESVVDNLGRPDVSGQEIVAQQDDVFTVPGIGVGYSYRFAVRELDDGSVLAIGQPLDDLRRTLQILARVLFATLLGVVTVLGLMFWWLARMALQPFDQIIQTADAIVDGDLDRRVSQDQPDPDARRLIGSINRMLDQNQEALFARTEAEARVTRFAAEASHELRTPLTTIAGYSEVYLSGASTDPEAVQKQMTRINGEATRLGRLVESMLTITRLDNDVGLETERVDLVDVAGAAISDATFASTGAESATQFSLSRADDGPLVVDGDSDSLYRVLANLLANAQVHAPGAEVLISLAASKGHAVVTVTDNGPGMPPHVADNAFDRFYRGSPTSDSGLRTTGLGLSIAAGIVRAHGGTIELATTQGVGATFIVRLPLASG